MMTETPHIELAILIGIIYLTTIIGVILTVLSENRNPLKATAWVVIVGFIPIVGLLAYVVFGQDQRRLHRINKHIHRRLARHPLRLNLPETPQRLPDHLERWSHLDELTRRCGGSPLLAIEEIEVYTSGAEYYDRLLDDIATAQHHIHLEAYIFDDDEVLARLEEALVARRQQGVHVRIIYDYLGSYSVTEARWQTMRQAGIQVYPFLPVHLPLLSSTVNYRNHRKVAIIDGYIGYVGGMNFAKRYASGTALGIWRDSHFRLTGDLVAGLQSAFLLDWYVVSRRVVSLEQFFPHHKHNQTPRAVVALGQTLLGGPMDEYPHIEQAFTTLISRAERSIRLQTPYLLPTEAIRHALITIALSGVRVEVMIPKRSDSRPTDYAIASFVEPLLEAGVEVLRYEAGFLHAKVLVVDGCMSAVGSANMDFRSLEHNFEICTLIYGETLAQELSRQFDQDRQHCERLTLETWRMRSRIDRLGESTMRLFSPLL